MFKHVIIIIALFFLQACATSAEQSQRSEENTVKTTVKFVGELDGLKYTNSSIPAELLLPEGWFLKLPDNQFISIDDSAELVELDPLLRNNYRLLYLLKYKELPAGEFNTSLIFIVSEGAHVKSTTAELHNQRIKAALAKSGKGYQFDQELSNKKLSGKNFSVMHAEVNIQGIRVLQEYQSVIVGGRLMTFILTYVGEKGRKDLEVIMETLKI